MTVIRISMDNVSIQSKKDVIKKEVEIQKKELPNEKPLIIKEKPVINEEPVVKEEGKEIEPELSHSFPSVSESEKEEEIKGIIQREFIPEPSISDDYIKKAIMMYKNEIQKKIKSAKSYPLYAKRMNQEGIVRVKFTLRRDGTLKEGAVIIKKCRYKILNDEAVKTIVRANPYPSFPSELKKDEMAFTIDLNFRLEGW